MQVTKKSEYAILSVLYLAKEGRLCDINEIASAQRLPVSLTAKTLQDLARSGILSSKRGPGGGFSLTRKPGAISILEIIEAVEGPLTLCECLGNDAVMCENRGCGLEPIWTRIQSSIRGELQDITIGDIVWPKDDDFKDSRGLMKVALRDDVGGGAGSAVVLCDFDGTISKQDVSDTIFTLWLRERWAEIDQKWHGGTISMVELYEQCWALVDASQTELYEFIDTVEIDPYFAEFANVCKRAQIPLYLASDGFDLYIERIMRRYGLTELPHYSNHLEFLDGRPVPEFNNSHPDCIQCANCKKFVLDEKRGDAGYVIYIGNGLSDRCAAEHADLVFAKDSLLAYCREKRIACVPYNDFGEITEHMKELYL